MKEYLPIMVVAVIFMLSLGGAIVLFKFLKSSALVKRAGYQAGGALAGFLLIYGTLFYSYEKMNPSGEGAEQKTWTIVGTVKKEGNPKHDGIVVRHVPPAPSTLTDASGLFRLENVRSLTKSGFPEIYIESDGYYPRTLTLNEGNAVIESGQQTIRLKDELKISKVME